MAIVGAELTTGGTPTPSGSVNTASVSPSANALVLITVKGASGGGTAPDAPTVTGNGLTWVQVATQTFTDGSSETHRLTTFRALGASPSSGVINIAHSGNVPDAGITWTVREYTGVDTGGTNGSAAVVQSDPNTGTGTAISATLAAFGDAVNNAVDIAAATFAGSTLTPEGGYTGYTTDTTEGNLLRAAWKIGEDTTPSMTLDTSFVWAAIALEIKAAAGGGGDVGMKDFDAYVPQAAPAPGPVLLLYN
jgi:hypothetical protein